MHRIFFLLFPVLAVALSATICLSSPIERKINNVAVEVGRGTRDIMPFLEKVASRWGQYFDRVYGIYREEHILININANSLYLTFDEIANVGNALAREVAVSYPLCKVTIIISVPKYGETWRKLQWEIENGEIVSYSEN